MIFLIWKEYRVDKYHVESQRRLFTYLEFVLVIAVSVRQMAELLSHLEAVVHVLRRNKVFGHLDAAVQIPHLRKGSKVRGTAEKVGGI